MADNERRKRFIQNAQTLMLKRIGYKILILGLPKQKELEIRSQENVKNRQVTISRTESQFKQHSEYK